MAARSVKTLPVLEQSRFLALPEIPAGAIMVLPRETSLRQHEAEMALGIIATVCAGKKAWGPVSVVEYADIVVQAEVKIKRRDALLVVNDLQAAGKVDLVRFGNCDYVVPTPEFADALKTGWLRSITEQAP